jgi:hypothetical protein
MFSGREGFELVIDDEEKLAQIDQILENYLHLNWHAHGSSA